MRNKSFDELQQEVVDEIINEMNAQDALSYGIEPINEMAPPPPPPSYGGTGDDMVSVHFIPARHGYQTDYFKLVRGTSYDDSEVVCRISLRSAAYAKQHRNDDGKRNFWPTKKEIKEMARILGEKFKKDDSITVLQAMIALANEKLKKKIDPNSVKPEDYAKLPVHR